MIRKTNQDQFMDVIFGRRSIRRYRQEPVPGSAVEAILEAAIWAPSAHNRQPWRFVVIYDLAVKELLATAMGGKLRSDLMNDGLSDEFINKDVNRSFQRLTQAPVLILLCLNPDVIDHYPDESRHESELVMAIQSVAMAGQNMLLAAHALGLGACWLCAPLFCQDVVVETLNLTPRWLPQGLITLGFPDENRVKSRQSLSSVAIFLDDEMFDS